MHNAKALAPTPGVGAFVFLDSRRFCATFISPLRRGQPQEQPMPKKSKNNAPRFLFKFYADCGRMGSLYALFTATQQEVDEMVGKTVRFGEVLGKHSDISVDLDAGHFKKVDVDAAFIAKFEELRLANGYDPRSYLNEDDE
jgi:hypothetical protein